MASQLQSFIAILKRPVHLICNEHEFKILLNVISNQDIFNMSLDVKSMIGMQW